MQYAGITFPPDVVEYMTGGKPIKDFGRCEFYANRVAEEYEQLKPWLPKSARHIVDIGCGVGGIDVFLGRHYPTAAITLMDGAGDMDNRRMGYHEGTQPWANVERAKSLVTANTGNAVTAHSASAKRTFAGCDLLISHKSWAHHYPAHTYMALAKRSVIAGGIIIVDIRSGTDGLAQFAENGFALQGIILDRPKCKRVVLQCVSKS